MPEMFKDVKGYKGLYKISRSGKVLSVKKKVFLKQEISNGTPIVRLLGHRKEIALLLAEAFIPQSRPVKYVKHIDGDRENNNIDNLRWSRTPERIYEEYSYPRNHNRTKKLHIQGVKATLRMRKRIAIWEDKYCFHHDPLKRGTRFEFKESMLGINNVAKKYGVPRSAIYKCCNKKIKAVGKRYKFRVQPYRWRDIAYTEL